MSYDQLFLDSISSTLITIMQHPFLQGLESGKLDRTLFITYVQQDAIYLKTYSQALTILSGQFKLNSPLVAETLLSLADLASQEAIELHEKYCETTLYEDWRIQTPAGFAYSQFMLATVRDHFTVGIAALLPCFIIYWKVATELKPLLNKTHPYSEWFSLYRSEAYFTSLKTFIELTNQIYQQADEQTKFLMLEKSKQGALLELAFWDDAFHQRRLFF
jgi:thiaminase